MYTYIYIYIYIYRIYIYIEREKDGERVRKRVGHTSYLPTYRTRNMYLHTGITIASV